MGVSVSGAQSPSSWLRKGMVLAITVMLVILVALGTIANVGRSSDPAMIMRLWPADAQAPALVADRLLVENPDLVSSPQIAALARQSLLAQAINPRALRILAFFWTAKGDYEAARSLMQLSERASRRDLVGQLWLIEDSVRRDDVRSVLSHYDVALRARSESREMLLPILTNALDDGELRRALVPYVRENAPWLHAFLSYAIANSRWPSDIVAMLQVAGGMPANKIYRDLESRLIAGLTAQGAYAVARQYYVTLDGADKSVPTYAGFSAASIDQRFAPLTWQLVGSSSVGAAFERGDGSNSQLRVFANSDERAVVLRRLLYLSPGRYGYHETRKLVHTGAGAEAFWELKCAKAGSFETIWRSNEDAGSARGLTIPQGCSHQFLELTAVGGSDQEGMEFLMTAFSLRRDHRAPDGTM